MAVLKVLLSMMLSGLNEEYTYVWGENTGDTIYALTWE